MDLQCFREFAHRPPVEYIDSWRRHISETGSPETFVHVSTTQPARKTSVVLLSEEIRVPTALRADRDRVPCPLCSPTSPKFGTGRMAWFPQDEAVRFIGHRCAHHFFGDDYTEAERIFRIEAKCAEFVRLWPELHSRLAEIEAVVRKLYGVGHRLHELRSYVDAQSPGFARFLFNDLVAKGGGVSTSRDPAAQTYRVEGLEFLSIDYRPEILAEKAMAACRDIRAPLPFWQVSDGENAASKEIMRRGASVVKRMKEMLELRELLADSSRFLHPTNLKMLERWKAIGQSPFSVLSFKRDGQKVEALAESYAGRFQWSVVVPADLLENLPSKDDILSLGLAEIIN